MQITVSLHGVLRINRCKKELREYPEGSSVQTVIDDLQIPVQLLGIILINGIHAKADDTLQNDDILMLLPLLEGG